MKKNYINPKVAKELSLCPKFEFSNSCICATWLCKLLICQTQIIWSIRIHSLKYLKSTTLGCKDIGIRKSEFVAKTQFILMAHIEDMSKGKGKCVEM